MSRKRPTKAQKDRLDRIHSLPCLCCIQEGVNQPWPTQAHHLVDRGYRKHSGGHDATIPLCAWHHVGLQVSEWLKMEMTAKFGPSLGLSKRKFVARYGTERELLARTDDILQELQRLEA